MDFKSLLQSFDTIAEGETKETEKGREHKGDYGNKYGKEDVRDQYGHKVGRIDKDAQSKKEEPKRGRGRPTKASVGDAGVKFDTTGLQSMLGGKAKGSVGKTSVKHSLKEYIEEVEANQQLVEGDQVTIAPAQQNTQVIKQGDKTLGTVTNPQLAQQIKQAIGQGDMTLAGDELSEDDEISEVAAPGQEEWVQANKERFIKQYGKEKGIPILYATSWKRSKASESVNESVSLTESPETLEHIVNQYKHEVKNFLKHGELDSDLYDALFGYYMSSGEMPYGVAKERAGDPYEWVCDRFNTDVEGILDESSRDMFRTHGMNTKPITPVRDQVPPQTSWKTDPVKAATDRAYDFVASLKPTKSPFSEGTEMKDIQLEGWENQLSNLLNEGITVSSSTGQQSSPDSVTVSATDADAEHLLSVLRNAGVGLFGDGEEHTSDYGAPMSSHEPEGHGQEPELAPTVVGDGDDMMALIKKMTGIEMDSGDYEDEEGSEELAGTLEPADADEEHDSEEDKEETDEGNAFTGKLAQTQQGDEFELDGEKYKDTSSIEEGEQECNECGMMESQCECDHEQVEENFSNDAGGDAMENTEMAKLKALLSMGNDLHKMKSSQAMGNPVKVAEDSSINDWKKLAGI